MDSDHKKASSYSWSDEGPSADADALRQAQPLNIHMCSADERLVQLARYLYDEFVARRGAPRFLRIRDQMVCVLLNLYFAYLNHPERYVRYARDPARYTKGRYNQLPITWKKLDRIVRAFRSELIEHHNGIPGFNGFEDGRQARMRATRKLLELMVKEFRITPEVVALVEDEVIILKGEKDSKGFAERLPYRDTGDTRKMRTNLKVINDRLSATWIDICIPDSELHQLNLRMGRDGERIPIDFQRRRLRRIFNNGSFKCGGRFYHGWWQEVPAEYRPYIQINGQQTVEIDFSGMHFAMFYADVGLTAPSDPYLLPGVAQSERKIVKKALNALINASNEDEAIKAIRSEAQQTPLPDAYPRAEQLVGALREKHGPIQHFFCTGEGLRAQFTDSVIAEKIMLHFAERGVPILPVHDSFIVAEDAADQLRDVMTRAFETTVQQQTPTKVNSPQWDIATDPRVARLEQTKDHQTAYAGYYSRQERWQQRPQGTQIDSWAVWHGPDWRD